MEFYQVINNRRTIRDLKTEPVSADVLERIIAAGIQAPTHDHRREWEFVILREEEEKENALQFVKAFAEAQGENRLYAALLYRAWLSGNGRCCFGTDRASDKEHFAFW